MTERDLLKMKAEMDQSKVTVAGLKGELAQLMRQLKDTFGCADVLEAQEALKKLQKDLEDMQAKIKKETEELEALYEQNS
jgi:septal ring factor EnvC (AmiA/AmiB activator)